MRRRRFLLVFCSAAFVVVAVNELAKFLGENSQYSTYEIESQRPYHFSLKTDSYHDDGVAQTEASKTNGTKLVDSVIPGIFFESLENRTVHNFRFIINPKQYCSEITHSMEVNFTLLILIASAPWEYERRDIIRRTWAKESLAGGTLFRSLFFVGNDRNFKTYVSLKKEFAKHGDIVMEDYTESYRNLSLKTQGQLKWAVEYCPNIDFVLHVDDDVVPDITRILQHFTNIQHFSRRHIGCAKVFMPAVRREGKWKTSIEEYPGNQYPLSCVGWCFILPMDIARELYQASLVTRILHLEDVWVTGILREKIGETKIQKLPGGEKLCQHLGWPKDRPTNEKIFEAWRLIRADLKPP